jgi:biopolymer transport protein ExbD
MRKIRSKDGSFELKIDMTPLIDCVFLLILFFILTTQITVQIEELDLPFALEGKTPESEGELSLILNIPLDRKDESESRRGRIMYDGREVDLPTLKAKLEEEVAVDAAPPPYGRGRTPELGHNNVKLSQLEILIRADKEVRSEYLRSIFTVCQQVGIYKIKLSSMQPVPY